MIVKQRMFTVIGALLICLVPSVAPRAAQTDAKAAKVSNDDCLACHGDKSMTTKRGGRTVSLYVDKKKLTGSIHGSLDCTSCHAALEGTELPHAVPVAKVNCGSCHSDEGQQHAASLHGKAVAHGDTLAPRCVNCHGNHDILPVKDPRSAVAPLKIPFVCGQMSP